MTPWTVACYSPLSMGFLKREYWNGLHLLLWGSSWPRDRICVSCIGRSPGKPLSHQGNPFLSRNVEKNQATWLLNEDEWKIWRYLCLPLLQIYSLFSGLGPSEPYVLCLQQIIPVKSRNLRHFPWEGTLLHSDDSGSQLHHSFFPRDSWNTGFIAKMPSSKIDYKKNSLSRWLVL